MIVTIAAAILLALAIDLALGEPPACVHPVVAMGRYLQPVGRWAAARTTAARRFVAGALLWSAGALVVAGSAAAAHYGLSHAPWWLAALGLGLLLKPLLAWRMLRDEVQAVDAALEVGLHAGRAHLARLVSRDVAALDAAQVREAAIESLAENLNDSVVAPLFWFAVLGLPGAALYRYANTADAMWGYRNARWEWAGKWAARADDALSWLPARITAVLLLVLNGGWHEFVSLPREARRTPSPNSGWPMAAMALCLGVRLGKPRVYALHAAGRAVAAGDVVVAITLASKVPAALAVIAVTAMISVATGLA